MFGFSIPHILEDDGETTVTTPSCWMIERPPVPETGATDYGGPVPIQCQVCWLMCRDLYIAWTPVKIEGLRFSRKEDAEAFALFHFSTKKHGMKITEHHL